MRRYAKFWSVHFKGRGNFVELGLDRRIILICILKVTVRENVDWTRVADNREEWWAR
jgi:hypothetical protein